MPRTSRALAVIDEREVVLKAELQRLAALHAAVEAQLEQLADLRRKMQALPKRPSCAKRTVSLPAQPPAAA
jgi:hypothetical protein